MILFLRNIPASCTKTDIINFVKPGLKSMFNLFSGKILDIEILILHNPANKLTEYHGLVTVSSYRFGKRAIRALSGKFLKGSKIIVREYKIRSWHNDRRIDHSKNHDFIGSGNRKSDRRRSLQQLKTNSELFIGIEQFSRKLM